MRLFQQSMTIGGAVGALIRNTRLFELACSGNINVRTRTPTKRGNPTLLGQPSSHMSLQIVEKLLNGCRQNSRRSFLNFSCKSRSDVYGNKSAGGRIIPFLTKFLNHQKFKLGYCLLQRDSTSTSLICFAHPHSLIIYKVVPKLHHCSSFSSE